MTSAAVLSALPRALRARVLSVQEFGERLACDEMPFVLIDARLLTPRLTAEVAVMKQRNTILTVVILAPSKRDRHFGELPFGGAIRIADHELSGLWRAVRHDTIEWAILTFMTFAARRLGATHRLVRALHAAVRAPEAIHSVRVLAERNGWSVSTLNDDWSKLAAEIAGAPSLHEILSWIALLRGVDSKHDKAGWGVTFAKLGWAKSTAQSFSRKQTGRNLSEVAAHEFPALVNAFRERALRAPEEAGGGG